MKYLFSMLTLISALLLGGVWHNTGWAQVGIDRVDLWSFETPPESLQSVVKVEVDGAIGTGTIVCVDTKTQIGSGFSGYCLTANHVVEKVDGRNSIRVTYSDGKVAQKCRVVARVEENDVALLWVWVPRGVYPVQIAKKSVFHGDSLLFSGLGGGSSLNHLRYFRGLAAPPTNDEKIFANISLLPGDSGGPVFNSGGELVGIISGGWLWFDPNRGNVPQADYRPTWPGRACNVDSIQKLLHGTKVCHDGKCRERLDELKFVATSDDVATK